MNRHPHDDPPSLRRSPRPSRPLSPEDPSDDGPPPGSLEALDELEARQEAARRRAEERRDLGAWLDEDRQRWEVSRG